MDLSVTELTFVLEKMAWLIAILASLLLLVTGLTRLLGRLTRTKTAQTDLDLVGLQAKVVRAVKPPHKGRITGHQDGKTFSMPATSGQPIKSGRVVLITAIDEGVARIVVKTTDGAS